MFKMFRSLRWRIQSWYALILLASIVGFGSVLHWEMLRAHWDDVDSDLVGAARILEGSLRRVPREILDSLAQDLATPPGPWRPPSRRPNGDRPMRPNDRRPPLDRFPERIPERPNERSYGDRPPFELSELGKPELEWTTPEETTPEQIENWEQLIDLPKNLPQQIGREDGVAYFVIWRADLSVLREENLPSIPPNPPTEAGVEFDRARYIRQNRGPFREVFLRGPNNTLICVGRSVLADNARIHNMTIVIISAGTSIFLIALVGGWWTTRRALIPLDRMGQTANQISASSMSKRMDLHGVDLELENLGAVLNKMLDRLDASFEQQQRFTADASHELRTPLSIMLSNTELALSKSRTPEEYRGYLETCQRSAQRMHQLVESLLALARLDSNKDVDSTVSIDLVKLITESVELLEPLSSEHHVTLRKELSACSVYGNGHGLFQVVSNLLINAIHYNHAGGFVNVVLSQEDRMAVIRIENSGPGIPADDLPHIFERFYRVDKARTRTLGGNGLGLAICERIVSAHHGTISADSIVDVKTTFTVRLPMLLANA